MTSRLLLAALALSTAACAGTEPESTVDDVTASDGTAVFAVRADTRKCAFPMCGGFFVSRVNKATTTCPTGPAAAECYVAELDLATMGATAAQQDELRGAIGASAQTVSALFRGKLGKKTFPSGAFGRLNVTQAFTAPAPAQLGGTVYKVSTTGGDCGPDACVSLRQNDVNTSTGRTIFHIAVEGAGGDDSQQNDALVAAYSPTSLLALGTNAGTSKNRVFTASSYFTPMDPGESLCGEELKAAIADVTSGWLWTSESDYPMDPILVPGAGTAAPTPELIRQTFDLDADTPIEERGMYVIANHGANDPAAAPEERALAVHYRALRHVLEQNLTDIHFFYTGSIQVGVYIVGRTRCGELAGFHSISIET